MIYLTIAMYVWAGLTTAFALRLFDDVKQALGEIAPFKEGLKSVKYTTGVFLTIAACWPVVLLVWLRQESKRTH